MADQDQPCFFCNKECKDKDNTFNIFKTVLCPANIKMSEILGNIVDVDITEDAVHTDILCAACFALLTELMEIEDRSLNIRNDLQMTFQRNLDALDKKEKSSKETGLVSGGPYEKNEMVVIKEEIPEEGEVSIDETEKTEDSDQQRGNLSSLRIPENSENSVMRIEEESYVCKFCPHGEEHEPYRVDLTDLHLLVLHLKAEHDVKAFVCEICGWEFQRQSHLTMHSMVHASEVGEYYCEICQRIFRNMRLFRVHRRFHFKQSKNHECEICRKRFGSRMLLEEHRNMHLNIRPYQCTLCDKNFASKYTYKAHQRTHEQRERKFPCAVCGKCFLSVPHLVQHEKTHIGSKDFVCSTCNKRFSSARNLSIHYIVHTGEKPYGCSHCSKAFARKAEVRDHERTHTGERPFKCDLCSAAFAQRSNLQSHRRVTHFNDKRYNCDLCSKAFKRKRLLDYHMQSTHTGERPFACELCSATFVYPEHYKKHVMLHSGKKPYKCEMCHKAFNSRDNRNAHRYIHSDKKPYECIKCGAGFMRKALLYSHMQVSDHVSDSIVINQPHFPKPGTSGEITYIVQDEKVILSDDADQYIIDDDSVIAMEGAQLVDEDGNIVDGNTTVLEIGDAGREKVLVTALVNDSGEIVDQSESVLVEEGEAGQSDTEEWENQEVKEEPIDDPL